MIIELRRWQESFRAALLLGLQLLEREQPGLLVVVGTGPLRDPLPPAPPRRRADKVVGVPLVGHQHVVQGQQPPLLTGRTTVLRCVSYSLAAVLWHSFFGRNLVVQHRGGLVTRHRGRSIIPRFDLLPHRRRRRARAAGRPRAARWRRCATAAAVTTAGNGGGGCARGRGRHGRRCLRRILRVVQFGFYDMFEEGVHLAHCERCPVSYGELVDLHVSHQLLGGVSIFQHGQLLRHVTVHKLVESFVIILTVFLLVFRFLPLLPVRLAPLFRIFSILLLVPTHRLVVEPHYSLELPLQFDEFPLISYLEVRTTSAGIVSPRFGQIHVEEVLAHGVQQIVHAPVRGIVGLSCVDSLQFTVNDLQEVDHLLLAETRPVPVARMLFPRRGFRGVVVTARVRILRFEFVLRMLLALVHLQMQQLLPDLAEELDKFSGKRFNSTCTDLAILSLNFWKPRIPFLVIIAITCKVIS